MATHPPNPDLRLTPPLNLKRESEQVQAEDHFRAIVEASPMPLLLSSLEDGLVLYANDRLETLLGVPSGSLMGRKTVEFYFDPPIRATIVAMVERQGSVRDLELRIKRADGTPRWVSLSVQPLTFEGRPALATALVDISEHRQAEAALRASEESYRGLFDNLTDLVYIQDLSGHFLNVNRAVLAAYGYARDEIIGQMPSFLADPERVDHEHARARFHRAVAGTSQRFDSWGRRKDGTVFPQEIVLMRSHYFGEDVVIGVARDISDRVEAEEALRRSEEHFRRLIENASDLISIIDAQGIFRYQSPAVEQVLGYVPEELIGKRMFDYLEPEDLSPTREHFQRVLEQAGTTFATEFRFRHKDGSWRYLEAVGTTLPPESDARGIVVNWRDITTRSQAEATLRFQKTLLEAQGEASIDGILVVSEEGNILSHNQRFAEMWNLASNLLASGSDQAAIEAVLSQVRDPAAFRERIAHLYAHPEETARDELALLDGRVFDRYSAPVVSNTGEYYGRIWFFRDMTKQKRHAEELERARQEADRARERANHYARSLEQELEIGRQIQKSFLPVSFPHPSGWEIAARFHPAAQVAGDLYDAFELPGGRIGLLIGDVSGKGVGAALFMALFHSLIRSSVERIRTSVTPDLPPDDDVLLSEAATTTNGYITRVHKPAHIFASVFLGLLEPETGILRYVNAGHEPPVLIGPDGSMQQLRPTGPALGVLAEPSYEIGQALLAPGIRLLLFTDGVTETRSADGRFFGRERLETLLDDPAPTAANLLDRIVTAVRHFCGQAPPHDDLTLLAVAHHPRLTH